MSLGRPSLRALDQNRSMARSSGNQANQRCDEFIVQNQHYSSLFKKMLDSLNGQTVFLHACNSRDDVVNALFDHADMTQVKPADIL